MGRWAFSWKVGFACEIRQKPRVIYHIIDLGTIKADD